MVSYKCFSCNKKISLPHLRGKVGCPYCGSKILYKQRVVITKFKAR